jgi:hypothetical protein
MTLALTGEAALAKRENLREKAEEFIANELDDEDILGIAETLMGLGNWLQIGGLFSVTIWYKRDSFRTSSSSAVRASARNDSKA